MLGLVWRSMEFTPLSSTPVLLCFPPDANGRHVYSPAMWKPGFGFTMLDLSAADPKSAVAWAFVDVQTISWNTLSEGDVLPPDTWVLLGAFYPTYAALTTAFVSGEDASDLVVSSMLSTGFNRWVAFSQYES